MELLIWTRWRYVMPMANSVGSSCKGTTGIELVENLSLVYGQKEVTFSKPDLYLLAVQSRDFCTIGLSVLNSLPTRWYSNFPYEYIYVKKTAKRFTWQNIIVAQVSIYVCLPGLLLVQCGVDWTMIANDGWFDWLITIKLVSFLFYIYLRCRQSNWCASASSEL